MRRIFVISFIILLIDVASKRLVMNYMFPDMSMSIIDNFFNITYVKNTGVAFSLLDGNVGFIIFMTVIIMLVMVRYIKDSNKSFGEEIGYGLVIGGAIGNLFDRFYYGYVIDFLDFKIFGYDFPIFNLADTFIVIGVLILVIESFREVGDGNGISG